MSGPIRSSIGRLRKRLNTLLSNFQSSQTFQKDPKTLDFDELSEFSTKVTTFLASIENPYNDLNDNPSRWSTLLAALRGAEQEKESKVYDDYLSTYGDYQDILDQTSTVLDTLRALKSSCLHELHNFEDDDRRPSTPAANILNSGFTDPHPPPNYTQSPHLPPLTIPTFTGNHSEWPAFWEIFDTNIHSRPLEKFQKFGYLLTYLKGPPRDLVDGLPCDGSNYDIAIKELQSHYNDPSIITHRLRQELITIQPNGTSNSDLERLVNALFRIYLRLDNLDDNPDNSTNAQIIQQKFPRRTMATVLRNLGTTQCTAKPLLEELRKVLRNEAAIDRLTNDNAPRTHVYSATTKAHPPYHPQPPRQQFSRSIQSRSPQRSRHLQCHFCQHTSHSSADCRQYNSATSRRNQAKLLHLCFNCLGTGHLLPQCKSRFSCRLCHQRHHTLLCFNTSATTAREPLYSSSPRTFPKNGPSPVPPSSKHVRFQTPDRRPSTHRSSQRSTHTRPQSTHVASDHTHIDEPLQSEHILTTSCDNLPTQSNTLADVLLMSTMITVSNPEHPEKQHDILAFFDSGSTRSYITTDLADKLELRTQQIEHLSINTFGTIDSTSISAKRHTIRVHIAQSNYEVALNVTSVPHLTGKLRTIPLPKQDTDLLPQHIPRSQTITEQPSILIGNDYMWDFIEDMDIVSLPSGFKLIKTTLGDIITGRGNLSSFNTTITSVDTSTDDIRSAIERLWSLESVGITDDPISSDDDICLRMTMDTIQRSHERYKVKWPWKSTTPNISSNLQLCKARLSGVYKQLNADPSLLSQYTAIFTEQLELGIIEEVPLNQVDGPYVHYLPHHAVITPQKTTTKVRIVYDASAQQKGFSSLNDCLYRGPVLLPSLCGVLLRCRTYPIILIADIQKAFLQVELDIPDRDVTRFLWLKDINKGPISDNLITYRFQRVPFGIVSSPFLLGATILFHLSQSSSPLSKSILRNLYVDNVLLHAQSHDEAIQQQIAAKQLFAEAGMNLRDWVSNNSTFNEFIKHTGEKIPTHMKLLGISWDITNDNFLISSKKMDIQDNTPITKRTILQYINSLFDPLGWISPIMLSAKLFLQTLWKAELGWDDPLPEHLSSNWKEIHATSENLDFIIPRLLSSSTTVSSSHTHELHIFTDASGKAHGAVAYLRTRHASSTTCNLLFSKSRLSPIHKMTIPRLELTALQIGVKMAHFLHKQLDIPLIHTYLWTDSKCSLEWLVKDDLTVYVKNRVTQICNAPSNTTFIHIGTKDNPADIISRGSTASQLQCNSLWWHGPSFLQSDSDIPFDDFKLVLPLHKINNHPHTSCIAAPTPSPTPLLDYTRFSTLDRLLYTLAFILFFIRRCTNRTFTTPILARPLSFPKVSTLREQYLPCLFYLAQQEQPPNNLDIQQLQLQRDDTRLYRCHGRIKNADLPYSTRFPIFLPRHHRITHLLILSTHVSLQHAGANHVLSALRQNVWIPKGRSTVQRIIRKECLHCRRTQSQPYKLPPFPDLPPERSIPSRPFENIGIDYMGPFTVYKDHDSSKAWICIFVCMFTRAIHCETIYTLSAEGFLHAYRRFISRRGKPLLINSDNGTQFKLAASTLQDNYHLFLDPCQEMLRLRWTFNTEHAPWQGGHFERMIGALQIISTSRSWTQNIRSHTLRNTSARN